MYVEFSGGKADLWQKDGSYAGVLDASTSGTLTLEVTVNGVKNTQTLSNMTQPSNEADFCAFANGSGSGSLSAALPSGSLTITSCSFTGSVGQISATLTISPSPVAISYQVKYTYS